LRWATLGEAGVIEIAVAGMRQPLFVLKLKVCSADDKLWAGLFARGRVQRLKGRRAEGQKGYSNGIMSLIY
jgi:hypothetical protein